MGRWLDLANSLGTEKGGGDNRDDRDDRPRTRANVPIVSNVPPPAARDLLGEWDEGIASLDPGTPRGGYPLDRWRRIVRDCDNVIADFGKSAVALGWSSIDLFGFPPGGVSGINLGGLVWRMDGGRLIAMDENCATYRWCFSDRTSRFARGYLENCLSVTFVPVWELPK